jgi:predicted metal-dependent phosphoesterase TrpH
MVQDVISTARERGISKLTITDHNIIEGALEAQKIAPDLIIVGEEVMTTKGELLALFVQELVPGGLSPEEAIRMLKSQGAFISVSHPFDLSRHGWQRTDLEAILPMIDAVEVFNARCFPQRLNRLAKNFARQNHMAGTVGSDAHTLMEIGRATMILPDFSTAEQLRNVIHTAEWQTKSSTPLIRLGSRYAVFRKQIGKIF